MDIPLSPSDDTNKPKCLKSVLYISVVILLFQSICNTELGIVSQFTHQNGNSWAGPLSTSLLFAGSAIGSIYNTYIVSVSYKTIFFLGSFGYTIFIGLAVIFLKVGFSTQIQIILLGGSFIAGLIVSAFYNGQFNYINTCSEIDKQTTKYFGLNMAIVQSANIVGNTISAILIKPLGQFAYAVTMDIGVFAVSLLFLFAKNYKYQKDSANKTNIQYRLSNEDKNENIKEPKIQQQLNKSQRQSAISEESYNQKIILLDPANKKQKFEQKCPYFLNFCFAFSGIMISFVYCELSVIFYKTFPDEEKEEINRITFAYIINGSVFLLSIACIYIGSHMQSFLILSIFSFIIGFCDCFGFAMALSIAGRWHESGLTMFNFGQSMTVSASAMMIAFLPIQYILIWSVLIHIFSTIGLVNYRSHIEEEAEQKIKGPIKIQEAQKQLHGKDKNKNEFPNIQG